MRLTISSTDAPGAITSTVKDFFALHDRGVSFTDTTGAILIITPDNVMDGMEIVVRQTGFVPPDVAEKGAGAGAGVGAGAGAGRKRRRGTLSVRKKSRRGDELLQGGEGAVGGEEDGGNDECNGDGTLLFPGDNKERIYSSDVSIDNIIFDSTRRRLTKFSSQVRPNSSPPLPFSLFPLFLKYLHVCVPSEPPVNAPHFNPFPKHKNNIPP